MYSLLAVGGIQYTTEMANKSKKQNKKSIQHLYRGVKDNLVTDARAASLSASVPGANATVTYCLAPLGFGGQKTADGLVSLVEFPHLPWLYQTSKNFELYRITNAKVCFVANSATTATGNFSVMSSPDYSDGANSSFATNPTGYPMSGLANRDVKVPLRIDPSWKKVSYVTMQLYGAGTNAINYAINTVNDLCFGSFTVSMNSSTTVGLIYIEYDVEFKNPINNLMNL
ncbi:hypothetical protein 3 [Hubei tombus-like virus 4]|uniref:hypothetical protein 3 n=1 Tax=Hubei tombus-like virus 4 TaxID=1923288 RepID=UPI00090A0317|nr:hypothetical protein 3 [Hubei tombus-like virus 4]APG76478.1 hypothetical protein 3 [Hubei tombus-like virus 4]